MTNLWLDSNSMYPPVVLILTLCPPVIPLLLIRNPPLLKSRVNRYFCSSFMSLLPKQKIAQKIQEKEDQKWYLPLSPLTQSLNVKNIPPKKKKKKTQIKKNMKICILQILEIWLKNFNRTR